MCLGPGPRMIDDHCTCILIHWHAIPWFPINYTHLLELVFIQSHSFLNQAIFSDTETSHINDAHTIGTTQPLSWSQRNRGSTIRLNLTNETACNNVFCNQPNMLHGNGFQIPSPSDTERKGRYSRSEIDFCASLWYLQDWHRTTNRLLAHHVSSEKYKLSFMAR